MLHVDFLMLELSIGNIYKFPLFGKSFYAQSTDLPSETAGNLYMKLGVSIHAARRSNT